MSRDITSRFGRRIQKLRNAKNMSQTILAEKLGTDQATISRIENGRHEPCLRFIELLAIGLKTPFSELFKDLQERCEIRFEKTGINEDRWDVFYYSLCRGRSCSLALPTMNATREVTQPFILPYAEWHFHFLTCRELRWPAWVLLLAIASGSVNVRLITVAGGQRIPRCYTSTATSERAP